MAVKKNDLAFRLPKITYVDYKHIEMDRVLLNLYPKLRFEGGSGRSRNTEHLTTVQRFVEHFTADQNAHLFPGFAQHPEIVERWLETDLLDLVNRGKATEAVVAPRPLHGSTYRYRTKHARDYYTADQVYWMLYHAQEPTGTAARNGLKQYIFDGLDLNTEQMAPSPALDVETQAILLLPQHSPDRADATRPDKYPPLYARQADLLAQDIVRLLAYEHCMPRTVLIEHLKTLIALHLGLYHLNIIKLLPSLVRGRGATPPSQAPIGLLLDCTGGQAQHMGRLARASADLHYRRIPTYIEAHYVVRKLDEMAQDQQRTLTVFAPPARGFFTVEELVGFLSSKHSQDRRIYFSHRLQNLLDQTGDEGEQPPAIDAILAAARSQGMEEWETFSEILMSLRGPYHRRFITQCLDAFLLKNTESGLLRQLRAKGSPREFCLGSRLLELLLQLAVCKEENGRVRTGEIRLEELIRFLRERYHLYVDSLPPQEGFEAPSIEDHQALRHNVEALKERLREIGYFQVLSDAYLSQTITPRYRIA